MLQNNKSKMLSKCVLSFFIGLFLFSMSIGCRNPFDTKNTTATITGRVTDKQNNPVQDTYVFTDPPTTTEKTNTEGRYTISNVSAGNYKLKASKLGYTTNTSNLDIKENWYACESGTIYRDMMLAVYADAQLGKISGKVINASNTKIKGVAIKVMSTEPFIYVDTTDTNGNYEIALVAPGDYTIIATKSCYDTATKTCTVKSGETVDGNIIINVSAGIPIIVTIAEIDMSSAIHGIAVDVSGNIYFCETSYRRSFDTLFYYYKIKKIDNVGIMTTIAGGSNGDSGDGGLAISAQFFFPQGIAVDITGNIYIADTYNDKIRKIDNSGIITTIAGKGGSGYGGDGGPAISAKLSEPKGIAVDAYGNIFFTDYFNSCVRKIDNAGIITTIAGRGTDYGDGVPAINADLLWPSGIAIDGSGNIFIADWTNNRVRKIDNSGIVTTIAGTGGWGYGDGDDGPAISAKLSSPDWLALDASGNLYVADGDLIRRIDNSGIIKTIAGKGGDIGDGGSAIHAKLRSISGLAVDSSGNIYIADSSRIMKIIK